MYVHKTTIVNIDLKDYIHGFRLAGRRFHPIIIELQYGWRKL